MATRNVIEILRKMQGKRKQYELAKELGISAPYLSDIFKGKREPGPAVLRILGLRKQVVYEKE